MCTSAALADRVVLGEANPTLMALGNGRRAATILQYGTVNSRAVEDPKPAGEASRLPDPANPAAGLAAA